MLRTLILLCLLTTVATAGGHRLYWGSVAFMVGGVALDAGTSYGMYEGNPLMRSSNGRLGMRGIASRHYMTGAGGIYVFNFHADRKSRRELLTQMGSPETLRGKDKTYAATYRRIRKEGPWRRAEKYDRIRGEVPVALKRTLTGDGPTITLDIADDLAEDTPASIELRVRLEEWVRGDVVRLLWDGIEVENSQVSYSQVRSEHGYDISNAVWLSKELSPESVCVGGHQVKVILTERNPRMACEIVLTDVELVIRYDES